MYWALHACSRQLAQAQHCRHFFEKFYTMDTWGALLTSSETPLISCCTHNTT